MHETDMFIQADQLFESYVTQVEDDQWDAPVPSTPDWTIRELVNHVAQNNLATISAITGGQATDDEDVLGEHEIDAWSAAAQTAEEAAASIDDYDVTIETPLGSMTVSDFLKLQTVDRTIHAWDLASALGFEYDIEPNLAEITYEYGQKFAPKVRAAGAFGEEIAVGGEATPMEKLLALSGRED